MFSERQIEKKDLLIAALTGCMIGMGHGDRRDKIYFRYCKKSGFEKDYADRDNEDAHNRMCLKHSLNRVAEFMIDNKDYLGDYIICNVLRLYDIHCEFSYPVSKKQSIKEILENNKEFLR
jgi:hypothetical protein